MKRTQKSHLQEDTAFNSIYGETLRGSENEQNRPSVGTRPTFLNYSIPRTGSGREAAFVGMAMSQCTVAKVQMPVTARWLSLL